MSHQASARPPSRDGRIVINCIGAGRWGPNVTRAVENLPDAAVHFVCDTNEDALARIRDHIAGVETTTDVAKAIEDPTAHAVAIATPVATHFELARRALLAGKHVFVEKPLCVTTTECDQLGDLAEKSDLVLAVGHVFLFNSGIRKVKEYIDAGQLGQIHYLHATRTNLGPIRADVNAAWDLAAHDLSIFDYCLDGSPIAVSSHGRCFLGGRQEDVVVSAYRYPKNVMAFMHVSWLNPKKVREITVVGEKRMVVWNDIDLIEPVRVYDKSATTEPNPPYADSFGAQRAIIRDGDVVIPKISGPEPLRSECAHFVECIRTGATPINNARMATRIVASLAASERSIELGGDSVAIGGQNVELCEEPVVAGATI